MNNCYQVGVFISRSSLQYVQIKKVWILSALQAINYTLMFVNTETMAVESVGVLAPVLIWVGLMGGAAYVNVMKNILDLKSLSKREREIALVLCLMFNDLGILTSSIFTIVFDNTIFKSQ